MLDLLPYRMEPPKYRPSMISKLHREVVAVFNEFIDHALLASTAKVTLVFSKKPKHALLDTLSVPVAASGQSSFPPPEPRTLSILASSLSRPNTHGTLFRVSSGLCLFLKTPYVYSWCSTTGEIFSAPAFWSGTETAGSTVELRSYTQP